MSTETKEVDDHPPGYWLGKTAEIEDVGRGTIIDVTPTCVGILLRGKGCRVMYVNKADLEPYDGDAR